MAAYQHMNGQVADWLVPDTDPDAQPSQTHPDPDDDREVWKGYFALAPGAMLEIRTLYAPAGETQEKPDTTWEGQGAQGSIVWDLTWDNGAATATTEHVVDCDPSQEDNGAEADGNGGIWPTLRCGYLANVVPDDDIDQDVEAVKWNEQTLVTATCSHRGGVRSIHTHVAELPRRYVEAHDDSAGSAHVYPKATPHPDLFPKTDDEDGATYEERRFGTHRALDAARNQGDRAGPVIFQWSAYMEGDGTVGEGGNPASVATASYPPTGVAVTGAAQECLWDSNISTWRFEAPGFSVPGNYARRDRECHPFVLVGEHEATIPVRFTVWAKDTNSDGKVTLQTSNRSKLILPITGSSYAKFTITGFVECQRAADDLTDINGMIFAASGAGQTCTVLYASVEYCDFSVG